MIYEKRHTEQISFPLGGIGTGSIGLSGTGRLIDWEIQNRPNKNSYNGFSHFAIRAGREGEVTDARVLQSDLPPHYMGSVKTANMHSGFGFGPDQVTMAGLPHFRALRFKGEYPVAVLEFQDETFPGRVTMTAFNPLIPSDDKNSSLPAAFFEFEIENPTEDPMEYTVALSVSNPVGTKAVEHRYEERENLKLLKLFCGEHPEDTPAFGNLTAATDCGRVSFQEYWYRGGWSDGLEMYWNDFTAPGPLKNRRYEEDFSVRQYPVYDVGTLAGHVTAAPGEKKRIRFVLSWYFPNVCKSWDLKYRPWKKPEELPVWKNYYAELFFSSAACALYALKEFEGLKRRTLLFRDCLFSSSLPPEELDAIASNLSTLKSATVLRLTDGSFYGFEGCMEDSGCCEGSCQHVWNYAYALPFLFPKLERSMRDLEFAYSTDENGRMEFRLQLPLGAPPQNCRACVDGQMGAVIKTYREWKISGDDGWLREKWPWVKRALSYAWSGANEDRWDPDRTGVITGRQHHTLDMELFGPNSWLESFYLCALKAAAEMARRLGETAEAAAYEEMFCRGRSWTEANLFNGAYYIQAADLSDKSLLAPFAAQTCLDGDDTMDIYWNGEKGEIKYQIGEGCMIDQVIGQWHANNCGLGEILDPGQVRSALKSIFRNNYHESMRGIANTWRLFGLNDEGGVMICTWPEGVKKPAIPLTYNSETMHGFEYQFACHLAQEGMWEESHRVVSSIREKYDGCKRNPYNEFECGSNYARSMASYGLLLAYAGFRFDMSRGYMGFAPKEMNFQCFWSLDGSWGMFSSGEDFVRLQVAEGALSLREFSWDRWQGRRITAAVLLREQGEEALEFVQDQCSCTLDCTLRDRETLEFSFAPAGA